MRIAFIGLLALAFCLVATSASALKVGVVDLQVVIVKSKKGKAAKKRLKKIFDKKQKALDKKQKAILEMKKVLENPSAIDSPERRRKALVEYQSSLAGLQEAFVKNQQELVKKEEQLMKPIFKKLGKILEAYSTKNGYDLVLARSQHGVVFSKPALDITKAILKKMDQ